MSEEERDERRNLFAGIDPGKSGAISIITGNSVPVACIRFDQTLPTIAEMFSTYGGRLALVVIERVHSMPKQGVASTFTFGTYFGFALGLLETWGIRYQQETPRVWQQRMKCLSKGDKNVTKEAAQRLFRHCPFAITHATADSLLLAEYCRRTALNLQWQG
jgi:hypothetical protein